MNITYIINLLYPYHISLWHALCGVLGIMLSTVQLATWVIFWSSGTQVAVATAKIRSPVCWNDQPCTLQELLLKGLPSKWCWNHPQAVMWGHHPCSPGWSAELVGWLPGWWGVWLVARLVASSVRSSCLVHIGKPTFRSTRCRLRRSSNMSSAEGGLATNSPCCWVSGESSGCQQGRAMWSAVVGKSPAVSPRVQNLLKIGSIFPPKVNRD